MNAEVEKIRKRLEELEELRITGFVDEAQYAESRAYLERKLVGVVLKESAPQTNDADFAETQLMPRTAELTARPPRRRARWLPWLVAAAVVHLLVIAVYWWSASGAVDKPAVGDKLAADAQAQKAASAVEVPPPVVPTAAATIETAGVDLPPTGTGTATGISGTVSLSAALSQGASATDTVFVYARAVDGPPMPLAVIRKQVKDLPINFTLDDSMATWPQAKVSAFPRIIVTARVSKSGEGHVRAGDLQGQSLPVSAGTAGLQIEIDSVVKGSP